MALLHRATIRPTKLELLTDWVPRQPWGEPGLELVGAFRFDDPDGEVGIETHLLATAAGHLLQAPLTYRGAPLDGADRFLVCTMEHSVLGPRWVYDAVGDPVYVRVLASVLLAGVGQAEEFVEGADVPREPTVRVTGSGVRSRDVPPIGQVSATSDDTVSLIDAGDLRIVIPRRPVQQGTPTHHGSTLTGTWSGVEAPVLLAYVA